MSDLKYDETMWAEMKPDVYGGNECDQVIPGWSTHADGDRDGVDNEEKLDLFAETFPPGTKVVISEPLCPECGERRYPNLPRKEGVPLYSGPCECGFDWDEWVLNQYS